MLNGDVSAVCHISAANANKHVAAPKRGRYLLLEVFACTFRLDKFTAAKIIKKTSTPHCGNIGYVKNIGYY